MNVHHIKTWTPFFKDVQAGIKPFEVRKNDRDYEVGDTLILEDFDPDVNRKTGAWTAQKVIYKLDDNRFVKEGFVILGIEKIEV